MRMSEGVLTAGGNTSSGILAEAAPSPRALRQRLEDAVVRDLLGPAGGPDEEVEERGVSERYLVGMLAPKSRRVEPEQMDELANASDGRQSNEEGRTDAGALQKTTLFPSTLGLTCSVDCETTAL